ncbi:hypothetical protein ACPUEK_02200 [Marinomonas gallaica]|uniref:hypothetical protein n=1 Tax=Marinomonas gallaica TaxID=1806667 RepID=UPI000836D664|nr:hypothetical protein [Marinomonas gallaica]
MKSSFSLLLVVFFAAFKVHAGSVEIDPTDSKAFYQLMPVLICHDENYLSCQGDSTPRECIEEMKVFRDSCYKGDMSTEKELRNAMTCVVKRHSKTSTIQEFGEKCGGGIDLNLTKLGKYVEKNYTQEEIRQMLE